MDFSLSYLIFVLASLLIGIGVHEAMHAFTAHWLGDTTASEEGRLTLNPLAHIDLLTTILLPLVLIILGLPPILAAKPVPFNPDRVRYEEFGAALIGIAGPLTNLVLAVVGAVIIKVIMPEPGTLPFQGILTFIQINIGLFVFNMLPLPPLDGSRVLYAFAPEPVQKVMYQIESLGIFFILAILFLLLPVIGPILSSINNTVLRFLL